VGKTNKVISKRRYITGKALNVARGISRLGGESFAFGFMYEENGGYFERDLHREGVPYKFIWNEGRVQSVYKYVDRRSMLTEVVEDASPISEDNAQRLLSYLPSYVESCGCIILSGGLTENLPKGYMLKVLSKVQGNAIKVVDADGDSLVGLVKCGVDLVKPNLTEIQKALKVKITDRDSMIKACYKLLDLGAKRVLLSLGKNGAVLCDGKKDLYCTSLNVAMNSTAGAGDAMVAAASKALAEGGEAEDIIRCGVAAGTASVTKPDSISFVKEKYEEILRTLTVKVM